MITIKKCIVIAAFFGLIAWHLSAQSAPVFSYQFKNEQAQKLYESLSDVSIDGAAGHSFRKGKNILCWHTNAEIDDANGKPIPNDDPRRYGCSIDFDSTGAALPGSPF